MREKDSVKSTEIEELKQEVQKLEATLKNCKCKPADPMQEALALAAKMNKDLTRALKRF